MEIAALMNDVKRRLGEMWAVFIAVWRICVCFRYPPISLVFILIRSLDKSLLL
jgi:hypothetical protein